VRIEYDDKVATWEGQFTLGDEVQEELADRQVEPPGDAPGSRGNVLGLVAIVALVAALMLLAMTATYLGLQRKIARPGEPPST
jgi:hypothetical protein